MIGARQVGDSLQLMCVLARLPTGAADDVRRKQKQVGSKHQHDKGQSDPLSRDPFSILQTISKYSFLFFFFLI